jgi:hypothetical protein
MATIAIKRPAIASSVAVPVYKVNLFAILAGASVVLFVAYFIIPHSISFFGPLFHWSIIFVVFMPLLAFASSVIAVRQISRTGEYGKTMSYVALSLTSLYFITGLAIPFVLVGCYILYAYVL